MECHIDLVQIGLGDAVELKRDLAQDVRLLPCVIRRDVGCMGEHPAAPRVLRVDYEYLLCI